MECCNYLDYQRREQWFAKYDESFEAFEWLIDIFGSALLKSALKTYRASNDIFGIINILNEIRAKFPVVRPEILNNTTGYKELLTLIEN